MIHIYSIMYKYTRVIGPWPGQGLCQLDMIMII